MRREKENMREMDKMGEELDCGICCEVMHGAVTLMPCLHSYCGGCFSDWVRKSKECPNCRKAVREVKQNALLNNMSKLIQAKDKFRRKDSIIKDLDRKNLVNQEIVFSLVHPIG